MNKFLSVFSNKPPLHTPPIWFMRQAGRYLPEYRKTRQQAGCFLDLCYTPELACEVTLQPLRRFDFDAAILFADILLLPQALGQELWFVDGEGPRLTPIKNADILKQEKMQEHLAPIYQTVALLKEKLPAKTPLIGFAGSPWTVATYMIAGRGVFAQEPAHALRQQDESAFASIIEVLIETTTVYLKTQFDHGAQCLQLFDSWASSLQGRDLEKYCFEPNRKIVENLRKQGVDVPIIGFARAIGKSVIEFAESVGVDAIGLDQGIDLEWVCKVLPDNIVTQGNLDPQILVKGGDNLAKATRNILDITRGRNHIFNLGHGIVPQTPLEHVTQVLNIIKHETD